MRHPLEIPPAFFYLCQGYKGRRLSPTQSIFKHPFFFSLRPDLCHPFIFVVAFHILLRIKSFQSFLPSAILPTRRTLHTPIHLRWFVYSKKMQLISTLLSLIFASSLITASPIDRFVPSKREVIPAVVVVT